MTGNGQCAECPMGTYQDKDFHVDMVCKNCSSKKVLKFKYYKKSFFYLNFHQLNYILLSMLLFMMY